MEVARLRTKVLLWRAITLSFFALALGLLVSISFLWKDSLAKSETVRTLTGDCLSRTEANTVIRLSERISDYNDVCINSYSKSINILEDTMPRAFTAQAGILLEPVDSDLHNQ